MAEAAGERGREVSREEARKLIDEGAQLVDVRADHEWEAGRIAGATHVPLPELPQRAGEIDKDRPGRRLLPRRQPLLDGDRRPHRGRLRRGRS